MLINWENVRGIDDEKKGGFRSKITFKDGSIERRPEKFSSLSLMWDVHRKRARQALTKENSDD